MDLEFSDGQLELRFSFTFDIEQGCQYMDSERSRRTEFFIRRRNCNWTRKSDLSVAGEQDTVLQLTVLRKGMKAANRYLKRGIDGILDWIIKLTDTGASDWQCLVRRFLVKNFSKAFKKPER